MIEVNPNQRHGLLCNAPGHRLKGRGKRRAPTRVGLGLALLLLGGCGAVDTVGDVVSGSASMMWSGAKLVGSAVGTIAGALGDLAGLAFSDLYADRQDSKAFFRACYKRIDSLSPADGDPSIAEATDRDHRWTALFDYMISLFFSADADQVSAADFRNHNDTEEDWPLRDGYGRLVARLAAGLPIALNAGVDKIDWSGPRIRLTTVRGEVSAEVVILAPSTAILGGGAIRFLPELPDWKQEAVAALPLGNHNRIGLVFDANPFGDDHPGSITVMTPESEPMGFVIRPFGFDYVFGNTGGRFADWLERAGEQASIALAKEKLATAFGSDITKRIVGHKVTAWRGDPLVGGAYSAALPGQAHQRAALARPLDARLFFAGEATSSEFYATAHGAYLSGLRAADQALAALPPK